MFDFTDGRRETLLSAVSFGPLVHPGSHCLSLFTPARQLGEGKLNFIRLVSPSLRNVWTLNLTCNVHSFPHHLKRGPRSFFDCFLNERSRNAFTVTEEAVNEPTNGWLVLTNQWFGDVSEEVDLLASSGRWHRTSNNHSSCFYRVSETKTNKFGLSESKETGLQPSVPVIKIAAFRRSEDVVATCPFYPPEKRAESSLLKEVSLFSPPPPPPNNKLAKSK